MADESTSSPCNVPVDGNEVATPATTYEVALTLASSSTTASLTATTWTEDFPIGDTIYVVDRDTPLAITESGTPKAYRFYDGRGATIDVRHQHD
jgi:hypothetical protein